MSPLLVSDVPEAELDSLASGPTLPDRSTVADCRDILERHDLLGQLPVPVSQFFQSASLPETPKPGAFLAHTVTLLSSEDLARAAARRAESLGFVSIIDDACDEWEYRDAALYLLDRLRQLARLGHKRVCLIAAGEVTVKLPPQRADAEERSTPGTQAGTGGRNQHFALYTATLLTPKDGATVVLSAGSDGVDGNSRFAGAVIGYEELRRNDDAGANRSEQEPSPASEYLRRFNSTRYLEEVEATLETGPTGNNLRDLKLLLWESR